MTTKPLLHEAEQLQRDKGRRLLRWFSAEQGLMPVFGYTRHDVPWPTDPHSLRMRPEHQALRVIHATRRLDRQIVQWRGTVESSKELREIVRVVGDSASKISARYREIEASALSVDGSVKNPNAMDSIASWFEQAGEIAGERISADPDVLGGKPYIKGTRIPIYSILEHLADGYTVRRTLNAFPKLEKEDIEAALLFASIVCVAAWKPPQQTDAELSDRG